METVPMMEMETDSTTTVMKDFEEKVFFIPVPPPMPKILYQLIDDDEDTVIKDHGDDISLELEDLEESDYDYKSDRDTDSLKSGILSSLRNRSFDCHQTKLEKLQIVYDSMKVLCFDELSTDHRPNVKECWAMYLKEFTEISIGMICLWIRYSSKRENTNLSTITVLQRVKIVQLDIDNMIATVEHLQAAEEFPTALPVWELCPEETSKKHKQFTLECLDLCRYFFEELYFGFDTDDLIKFFEEHLEKRVQFFYDLENGLLSSSEEKMIAEMIKRSRFLEKRIEDIEGDVLEDFEEDNDEELLGLLELQLEQEEIGNRIKRLENPVWRMLMKKLELKKLEQQTKNSLMGDHCFLVCRSSTPKELQEISNAITLKFQRADVKLQIVDALDVALSTCPSGGTIFIAPGTYQISGLKNFEYGGRIVGIPMGEKPIVFQQSEMSAIWMIMDFSTLDMLYFENIVFHTKFYDDIINDRDDYDEGSLTQTGIMIKDGRLHMKNCVVEGNYCETNLEKHEITHSAVVKRAEGGKARFTIENTTFKNIKCSYWTDGKKHQVIEEPIEIDWKVAAVTEVQVI